MKETYIKILKAYLEMLEIHINTKTIDPIFHQKTQEFYEKLFDIAHNLWERFIDLDWKIRNDSIQEQKTRALELLTQSLKDLEDLNSNWNLSLWTQDLVWWLADELEKFYMRC